MTIDYFDISVLVIVTFFSSIISATTGSGGGVLLFSVMTLYLPLFVLIPIHGFLQMCMNWLRCCFLVDAMRWKSFAFFSISACIGAVCAVIFIPKIPKEIPYFIIALFIFYTILKPKNIPDFVIGDRWFAAVGLIAGILGILVGAIGPFLALFYVRKDLSKQQVVANKSAMQAIIHTTKLPIFLYLGFSYFEYAYFIIVLLIAGLIGTRIGIYALMWIPQVYFFIVFKCALFFAGLKLLHQVFFQKVLFMKTFSVQNPFDNSSLGEFPFSSRQDTQKAIETIHDGKKELRNTSYFERAMVLEKLGNLLEKNAEKLAQLITKEIGKTISDSRIELQRSQNTVLCAASEVKNIKGETLHSDAYPPKRNRLGVVQWFPLGSVLAITPFNFPINIAMHKIAPAFAAGNTILFKPSPQNYLSGKEITRLCYEAGMSEGTLQMCMPDIETMSEVVTDPRIHCINFTGGTHAAQAIAKNAGFKKLLFELGGNDPLIVMDDADIPQAVTTTIQQRFGTAGQRCTACKRVYVHEKIYDAYKEQLLREAQKLKVGDPMQEDTFVGPLVNTAAADEVFSRIQKSVDLGAVALLGNKRENNIVFPTILENVTAETPVVAEETFGPVIPLFPFSDLNAVIESINASNYGLQSGVFTQNLAVAKKLYTELEVGALAVNDGPGFRAEHFPFGGVKDSGIGREGIYYAIREMSFQKTFVL